MLAQEPQQDHGETLTGPRTKKKQYGNLKVYYKFYKFSVQFQTRIEDIGST